MRHNRRIHGNKVLRDTAERGQCSLGWFYGFKLHLVINGIGKYYHFTSPKAMLTTNLKSMMAMGKDVFEKLYGNKGYIS
ncbi:transposase [Sphingobacterium cellulitidis]|uniref:transposase n=1 Tax=Sphingobacterium cellulitidis TaxID=1768011 RepID=UPI00296EAA37